MIWLYPPSQPIRYTQYSDGTLKGYYHVDLQAAFYDYLSDWNLTMPLAVEHELYSNFFKDGGIARTIGHIFWAKNKNPLRAICEVLVMIKLEGMK